LNPNSLIHSFNPIVAVDARVLILGSMPGERSLSESQYYAHPQNSFWFIMSCLFKFDMNSDYKERCTRLQLNKVALWDVLKSCERKGSLDSSINNVSIVANNFEGFLRSYPGISSIFFNGAKAESVFQKYVPANIQQRFSGDTLQRLPSTSPAYAAMDRHTKMRKWSVIKKILNEQIVPI